MSNLENLASLVKALEAGGYNAAPSTLVQGSALQVEDLSPVMHNVTFDDSHIKLQKMLKVDTVKSTLAQFDRQLSYGVFGGSAQIEGAVGQENTSDFVRIVVPMAFYSHTRRVTLVANMVEAVDGKKAEERAAADAAKLLAGDIEFDLFRGKADFSNAGVFDGNPASIATGPAMLGLDAQIRQSDAQANAKDAMFGAFGSNDSVVIGVGGTLTQAAIEDAHVRSTMNLGDADKLVVDPKVMSAYNKISYGKERIILAGSPQEATAADLRKQWVSGGVVNIEASRFLSGRTGGNPPVYAGPAAPAIASTGHTGSGSALAAGTYIYKVTAVNEIGESFPTSTTVSSVLAGEEVTVTITAQASARFFRVYRTAANGSAGTEKFIGAVAATGSSNVAFKDLGNKIPGFVTGFLVQGDTMAIKELAPYSRLKLAVSDLSIPEAHFRFLTLAVFQPRKNVLLDNIQG